MRYEVYGSVAGLIPPIDIEFGRDFKAKQYIRPVKCGTYQQTTSGDKVVTITICKRDETRYCNVDIFLAPYADNYKEGHAKCCVGKEHGSMSEYSEVKGAITNARTVTYNGGSYLAVDVIVAQYGSCILYLTGIHSNISDIMDVTGNV